MKKLTTESFIEKSRLIHGDKYDYSKSEYISSQTRVCIICPIHGEFWQTPNTHLTGCNCPICNKKGAHKSSREVFIKKATNVHGDKYDYSKVEYYDSKTNVCIICPEHGEFWQRPAHHVHGVGCPICANNNKGKHNLIGKENFIKKAKEIHGDKYDYSKVEYVNANDKICVICPEHGEFWQTPSCHINGKHGCPKCYGNIKSTTEEFIKKAKEIHGNKYDYSKVEYNGNKTKVCIICPEHGEFWQRPNCHLNGHGCSKCNSSKLENEIIQLLEAHKIPFIFQARKKHLEELNFLGRLTFDFYIPNKKIAIECQGKQHFLEDAGWRCESLKVIQERDLRKKTLCDQHGIKMLYYSTDKIKFPYEVYGNAQEIIREIIK